MRKSEGVEKEDNPRKKTDTEKKQGWKQEV
jgi:hypothetical protein